MAYRVLTEADAVAMRLLYANLRPLDRENVYSVSHQVQMPADMLRRLIEEILEHDVQCMTSDDVVKTIRQIAGMAGSGSGAA